jgi:hypothetical protein
MFALIEISIVLIIGAWLGLFGRLLKGLRQSVMPTSPPGCANQSHRPLIMPGRLHRSRPPLTNWLVQPLLFIPIFWRVSKEVGTRVLPMRSPFGGGILGRLLPRVSSVKSISAAWPCGWLRRTQLQLRSRPHPWPSKHPAEPLQFGTPPA